VKVTRHTGSNVGGLHPVQFVFAEDIYSFQINPLTFIAGIILKGGKSWNYLYATPETIQLESKEELTDAGMKYTYQIKMLIPKDRPEVEIILTSMNNRSLVINAIDKNGVSRYFGTKTNPMKKAGKILKPSALEGFNGWEVLFTGEFSSPAAYSSAPGTPVDPPE